MPAAKMTSETSRLIERVLNGEKPEKVWERALVVEAKYTLKQNPHNPHNVDEQYLVVVGGKSVAKVSLIKRKMSGTEDWFGVSEPSQGPVKSTERYRTKEEAADEIVSLLGL